MTKAMANSGSHSNWSDAHTKPSGTSLQAIKQFQKGCYSLLP